ncbi:hypothetical protein GCM10023196_055800 [Actinoallomurus vinaceus]|uniref:Uncharacterized protein n=1 Tax=Actinoallomurus vinaceus TaxID=1080074 RepID=A0ABP8UG48_9ACTN
MTEPPGWLRSALREEADAHEPDRGRIRARVDAAIRPHRARRSRFRPIAATAMAAAGVAVVAVTVVTWRPGGSDTSAVPAGHRSVQTDQPSPSASATASPTARAVRPSATPRAATSPPPTSRRTKPGTVAARLDPGSNPYWAQEDVTVTGDRPLTKLQVTVRVTRTEGVRATGSWSTLPGDDFVVTVGDEQGALVYRWVLRPGRSVPPGPHVFAAQYARSPRGHDAHDDRYTVTADDRDGRVITVDGGF